MNVVFNPNINRITLSDDNHNTEVYADSNVRNELNGDRSKKNPQDVIYSIPMNAWEKGVPYMPRPFPKGDFLITGIEETDHPYLKPYFIRTNAQPMVQVWTLKADGTYGAKTDKMVIDTGYGIHFGRGIYTIGCIRISTLDDIEIVAELVKRDLYINGTIPLKVL